MKQSRLSDWEVITAARDVSSWVKTNSELLGELDSVFVISSQEMPQAQV